MKKILAIVLTLTLVLCCVPFGITVNAAASGITGDCTWALNGTVLTISGSGKTGSYYWDETPWGYDITEVIVEDGVIYLGDRIFADCTKLSKVTLGKDLKTIRMNAFEYCESLESIEIPDGIVDIGTEAFYCTGIYNNEDNWEDGALYIGKHLICTQADNLPNEYSVKEGTLTIAHSAFEDCSDLTYIYIPESVVNIGADTFYNCKNLTEINIPSSVEYIGDNAFYNCKSIENVYIADLNSWCNTELINYESIPFNYNPNVYINGVLVEGELVIPDDIYSISAYTFYGLDSITSVVLGDSVYFIGKEAFAECEKLVSISMPEGMEVIEYRAFYACDLLESINIPNSVTYVGQMAFDGTAYFENESNWENGVFYTGRHLYKAKYNEVIGEYTVKEGTLTIVKRAFSGNQEITSVIIPEGVTTIDYDAFCYCPKLTSVTLPKSVTLIGGYAFDDCDALIDVYYGGTVEDRENIFIRENNSPLMSASWHCVEEVTSGITGDCTWVLNGTVLTISGNGAMDNYSWIDNPAPWGTSISKVIIEDGVTSVGSEAFSWSEFLECVTISDSVENIDLSAFYCCFGLKEVIVSENNKNYASENGVLFNKQKDILIFYPTFMPEKTYYVPDSVVTVASTAFNSVTNLESVILGEGVKVIKSYAFNGCTSLKTIVIPKNVTTIGFCAFAYCEALEDITIENDYADIGFSVFDDTAYYNNPENWENGAIYIGKILIDIKDDFSGELVIKEGTVNFAKDSCSSKNSLTGVVLPSRITCIPEYVFSWCSSLESVVIPSSINQIANSAFSGCDSLKDVWFRGSKASVAAIDIHGLSDELYFAQWHYDFCSEDKTHEFDDKCDEYCNNCGNIRIDAHSYSHAFDMECDLCGNVSEKEPLINYEIIDGEAVITGYERACLGDVILPEEINGYPITRIADEAFLWCDTLTSILIPNSVKSIGSSAFEDCNNLKIVVLGNGLAEIGNYAFSSCDVLESINIPDSVTSIGSNAFEDCNNLKIVVLGNGLAEIGSYAFSSCDALESINIPDSVASIGSYAFSYCKSLTEISLPVGITAISSGTFNYCEALTEIIIPATVNRIDSYAFYNCESLVKVEIPNGVKTIGECAFGDCVALESIELPDSLTEITRDAFYGTAYCDNPSNWENGVLYIGKYLLLADDTVSGEYKVKEGTKLISSLAFYQRKNVTSIVLPDSVEIIGMGAFAYCPALERVTLGSGTKSIGRLCCYGSELFSDVYFKGDETAAATIVFAEPNEELLNATWHYNVADEPELLKGDVNGDGVMNVSDLAQLKKLLAGLLSEVEIANLNADIDGNGTVNAGDLALLKKAIAGLASLDTPDNDDGNDDEPTQPETSELPLAEVPLNIDYKVADDFKIGVICLHDELSTYDANFINGINKVKTALNLNDDQVVLKTNIPEAHECYTAAKELAEMGCDIVFADSYGHENFMLKAAKEFPDVEFCHATGVMAHTISLDNFHNAFAKIHEGRYLTGVAAGMKLNELIKNGTINADNARIGFVGAFNYAECISAQTAFYLGAKSVCPTAIMDVKYIYSWYNVEWEKEAAEYLIRNGCAVISQYSDSIGAPMACEAAGVANFGYNVDYTKECPNTFVLSTNIDWSHYFNYIIGCVAKGEEIAVDWAGGIDEGAVVLSAINSKVAAKATLEVVREKATALTKGEINVFDTKYITVNGMKINSYIADVDFDNNFVPETEVVENGVIYESTKRSAPYFDLKIDGITNIN